MIGKPELLQEDIILISGTIEKETDPEDYKFTHTDSITSLVGVGSDRVTALQDHIVELILYYENKLRSING